MRTRQEHLDWCKARAREYLDRGEHVNAVKSMLSDLSKNHETVDCLALGGMLMLTAVRSPDEARRFIEGFN